MFNKKLKALKDDVTRLLNDVSRLDRVLDRTREITDQKLSLLAEAQGKEFRYKTTISNEFELIKKVTTVERKVSNERKSKSNKA